MADFSQPLIILVALLCGMLSRAIGLPALIGYLAAGFVLHELGTVPGPWLSGLADLGITLLLFSIGLKLDARKLLEQKVWGTTLVHMLVSQGLLMAGLLALTALAAFAQERPLYQLPSGPEGPGTFGAYYTHLETRPAFSPPKRNRHHFTWFPDLACGTLR